MTRKIQSSEPVWFELSYKLISVGQIQKKKKLYGLSGSLIFKKLDRVERNSFKFIMNLKKCIFTPNKII